MPSVRRLTAILAADVAGYSRLMGVDEEGTHERLKAHLGELIDPKIAEHRGRIVKNTGDGLLAEFGSVVEAVRCAVEVQRGMTEREPDIPEERRIRFRIGVNLGDVIVEDEDIFGDGVNVAARLEALAEPEGICISRVVRDQIRDKLPYQFEDLGEQTVKNIARPVRVYALRTEGAAYPPASRVPAVSRRRRSAVVAAILMVASMPLVIAVVAWWAWPATRTPSLPPGAVAAAASVARPVVAPRLSFVVLPFANLSNDPDQEYFADGITDDLTTDLSRISDSFVIAHTTALTYKGKPVDAKQLGRELGVRYVIEGSVRRSGNQVQANVQLIDAETGAHVWADRFDTDRTNLAKAQSEITGRLARTLNVELFQAASRRIEQERASDPDARDFAVRAWARVLRGPQSPATFEEALRLNDRALAIDPESVFAKNNMAQILVGFLSNGWSRSVQQEQARAEKLFREVLESDPNDARAHVGLGVLRRIQNWLEDARIELETGIALDPNHTVAVRNLGLTLIQMGKPEEAIPYIEKSIRLSPHDPTVANNYGALGSCYLLLGHLDQAIEFLRQARTAKPRDSGIHRGLAAALALRGDLDEAKAELAEAIKLDPKVNSLAALSASAPWITNPPLWALREKTVNVGLRRAGFPDE
jgi:adenylate cyclase